MRIYVDPEIFDAFPEAAIAGVVFRGLDNQPRSDAPATWTPQRPDPALEPRLEAWREAYRTMGLKPKRSRPSAEALLRQVEKRGVLTTINPIVDGYNRVSLRHLVPVGGYDLAAIAGDIHLTRARGGETFSPLPAGGSDEEVDPGEVVYRDERRVLTRRWNYRDGAVTAIQPHTTTVVLLAELPDDTVPAGVVETVVDDLVTELGSLGGQVTARFVLSAVEPTADLDAAQPAPKQRRS
jgi:DNA/RNA-binding domain of Phe-tRNA-synthetase-like protein